MCQRCEKERMRLLKIAMNHPVPCLVCGDENVVGAGTWKPDERHRLAAGANDKIDRIFAFCLCAVHGEPTQENDRLVKQAILRDVRTGKGFKV